MFSCLASSACRWELLAFGLAWLSWPGRRNVRSMGSALTVGFFVLIGCGEERFALKDKEMDEG